MADLAGADGSRATASICSTCFTRFADDLPFIFPVLSLPVLQDHAAVFAPMQTTQSRPIPELPAWLSQNCDSLRKPGTPRPLPRP